MGKVIFAEGPCRLSYSAGSLRIESEGEKRDVFLEDILSLVIESQQVSMTAPLLTRLADSGITVILCDAKRQPSVALWPLFAAWNVFPRLEEQISWRAETLDAAWARIVRDKIACQCQLLACRSVPAGPVPEVAPGDPGNAEGMFARQYFRGLFGSGFKRGSQDGTNGALNYGYTILYSAMGRIIAGHGYQPALGIHHRGATNNFNLASDCMEPFRPVIDRIVAEDPDRPLDRDYKIRLVRSLEGEILYRGERNTVRNAMELYFCDVMSAASGKAEAMGDLEIC